MNKLDLNDVTQILLEFLEVAIHLILYSRKIYPDGIFTLKKKYGVPIHVCMYPDLNNYITQSLLTVKSLLLTEDLKQIDVCFYNSKFKPIERFVFHVEEFSHNEIDRDNDPYLIQLRESLRAFCLKLSVNATLMKPLPDGTTFKILLHTTEASSVFLADNPQFQKFPWIEAEKSEVNLEEKEIRPIRNVETGFLKLQIYSEETSLNDD